MDKKFSIAPTDESAASRARKRWDSIAKPLGSLGELEDMITKLAAITGSENVRLERAAAVIFCGDNGIAAEGVTQCGSEVTAVCAEDIAAGRSSVNAIAKACGADVIAVDVGIKHPAKHPALIDRKIAAGTKSFTQGPAMTREQAERAIDIGIEIAGDLKRQGFDILIAGEMGIGNTSCAAAIASVLLGAGPEKVTGRGAGLSSEGLGRKISAVRRGIEVNADRLDDPMGVLSALGGFETAAMTGLFLGGGIHKIPVVADGLISAAAAATAFKLEPLSAQYMLASHCSQEPAARGLLELIGLRPVIDAGLRLGEGTGGVMLLPLLKSALAVYNNARSFDEAGIERYERLK